MVKRSRYLIDRLDVQLAEQFLILLRERRKLLTCVEALLRATLVTAGRNMHADTHLDRVFIAV